MMRLRIRDRSGYVNKNRGIILSFGEEFDADEALAVKLLKHGVAEPAPKPDPETTAARKPAKTTAKRTGKTITKADYFGGEA